MQTSDAAFTGSIPDIFDSHMVPLLFGIYAEDMAARIAARRPARVLETAAGSGVVTRALAPRLSPRAEFVVTDLNQPMLDRAARMQGADPRITWQAADALDLPFADAGFDALCCQFGVMFFPDRPRGHAEARRVLRPGGHYVFNVWDHIEANEFTETVLDAAASVFPADPPDFFRRTPHGHGDVAVHKAELKAAGFATVIVSTVEAESRAPSAEHAAFGLCQGTPLRNEIEARDPGKLDEVTDRAAAALRARFGTGPIAGRIRAHVIEAIA